MWKILSLVINHPWLAHEVPFVSKNICAISVYWLSAQNPLKKLPKVLLIFSRSPFMKRFLFLYNATTQPAWMALKLPLELVFFYMYVFFFSLSRAFLLFLAINAARVKKKVENLFTWWSSWRLRGVCANKFWNV